MNPPGAPSTTATDAPLPAPLAALAFVLMVLPWLEPFAPGPSAAAGPLMFAWLCSAIALGLGVARRPQLVAWAWVVAALLSALFGLMQYFGFTEFGHGLINYTEPGTAYGNLRQRNQFATHLSIGTLAVLYLSTQSARLRWPAVAIVLLAVANAASTSRTGVVQLLLIALVSLAWGGGDRARITRLALGALGAYAIAALTLPLALHAFTGIEAPGLLDRVASGPGCASRMVLWSNVLELIRQRPLAGWGVGELDYAHYAHLYDGARFCDILDNAHNLPLHLAVELGLPVAIACMGGLAWWIWRSRPWRETDAVRQLAWGVLLVIGVHSLLEYPLWYGPFQLAALLSVLLLRRAPRVPTPQGLLLSRAVAFVIVPLALAYAAWDYHRVSQLYLPPEERAEGYRVNPIAQAKASVLFQRQVKFAELSVTPLTTANARETLALALDMLHFSPEPRVIETVIDSAIVLHDEDTALWHMARLRAAFPKEYDEWMAESALLGRKRQ